jgi:protein O-GlcNAc transferase
LHDLRRHEEALAAHEKATRLDPSFANGWANLGASLNALKRHDRALAAYDRALAIAPSMWQAQGDRLHTAMLLCDWTGFDAATGRIFDAIARGDAFVHPFVLLPTAASAALQKRNAERWVAENCARAADAEAAALYEGHARIRLGYFSADFRQHAVMDLIAELFERHDRSRFELFAFSFGPVTQDAMRSRVMASFDRFVEVGAMGDLDVAALARSLELDIAVDLSGFTQDARPGIFAARAAPVQVNYLGYPGTMAAPWIDYLVADPVLIPDDARSHYSEQIALLPHCYQPNASWQPVASTRLRRHDAGLPEDGFVFCSFNNSWKITPDIFAVWMRLLEQVPGSVLWLIEANAGAVANLRGEAVRRGVAAERIVFAERTHRDAHLSRHQLADLFLDTLHYGAHTTASDALRAGLPVLTCLGETFPSRVAASLCRAVGLDELVSTNVARYEATALALAADRERLGALRGRLAAALPRSPLFDAPRFAHDLEQLYVAMHKRRRAGLPADHLRLPDEGVSRS